MYIDYSYFSMQMNATIVLTVFLTTCILQFVYIVIQYSFLRRREFLYYLGYILGIAVYVFMQYAPVTGYDFITNIGTDKSIHLDRALPMICYFFYYRFARYFANIDTLIPRLNTILKRMEYFVLGYAAFELVWEMLGMSRQIGEYIFFSVGFILLATTIYFSIWLYTQKNTLATYLAMGGVSVNFGAFGTLIMYDFYLRGIIDLTLTLLPLNIGVMVELLTFTAGLAYKTELANKERLAVQKESLKQANKSLKMIENLNQMRHEIAKDFHNDLSATLSGIGIYSTLLKKSIKDKPEQITVIADKIFSSSSKLSDSILDIIWVLNPTNKTLGDIYYRLFQFSRDELEPPGIIFKQEIDPQALTIPLNINGIKSIYQFIKNFLRFCISNNSKRVEVSFNLYDTGLNITLSNLADSIHEEEVIEHLKTSIEHLKGEISFSRTDTILTVMIRLPFTNISD